MHHVYELFCNGYHWKRFIVPIHLCPLAYALSLEASITNAYVEAIDFLEL